MKLKNILKLGFLSLAVGLMLTGCGKTDDSGNDKAGSADAGNVGSVDRSGGNIETVTPQKGDLIAVFEIEGYGTIKAVLFPDIAPVGVENFRLLANDGFYKGLTIHRVMEQFMFQGGSTNGNGTGGDAAVNDGSFGIETSDSARHFYGALCYANAGGQNSTQFYIVNADESVSVESMADQYRQMLDVYKSYAAAATLEDEKAYYEYYAAETQKTYDALTSMSREVMDLYSERGGTPFLDGSYTVFGQVYEGFDVIDSLSKAEVIDNGSGEKSKPVDTIVIKDITVSEFE